MVLTNFTVFEVESRLIGQEAAFPGSWAWSQGGARRVPTGPGGWGPGPAGAPTTLTTHSSPCRASGARFAVRVAPREQRGGWVVPRYSPPRYPPTHTPPWYTHPVPTRACRTTCRQQCGANSRFRDTVGEPRGTRTHRGFRVPAGYIQLLRFRRVYTAV